MKPLLAVRQLTKRFGALRATSNVDLEIARNEVHALIGPNGAGKTTLLAQITGNLMPDSGQILFDGADITSIPAHRRARLGMGRTFQINSSFLSFSVRHNVMLAVTAARSLPAWGLLDGHRELEAEVDEILRKVGLADQGERIVKSIGHGGRRQLEIAMAIVGDAKLIVLDEPLAGLAAAEASTMTELLVKLRRECALLLVEHDMRAVLALADRITVMAQGGVIASGAPAIITSDDNVRRAYLGKAAATC